MNNNLYVYSLYKAFGVLDSFQDDEQELGISDIAVLVGMPVSSVHRLIQSLEYEGMLIQNRENKEVFPRIQTHGDVGQVPHVAASDVLPRSMLTSSASSPARR